MRVYQWALLCILLLTSAIANAGSFTAYPTSTDTDGSFSLSWTTSGGTYPVKSFRVKEYKNNAYQGIVASAGTSVSLQGRVSATWKYELWITYKIWDEFEQRYDYSEGLNHTISVNVSVPASEIPGVIQGVPSTFNGGSFTLSWGAAAGLVDYYTLERLKDGVPTTLQTGLALSKYDTLTVNGSYTYRVRACNSAGCSGWRLSNTVDVAQLPSAPGAISFSQSTTTNSDLEGVFAVNWAAATGNPITGYRVFEERDGSWSSTPIHNIASASARSVARPSNCTNFPISCPPGLIDASYRYKVQAFVTVGSYTRYGAETFSSTMTVERVPVTPGAFTQPTSGMVTALPFNLSWGPSSGTGNITYQVEISSDGANYASFKPSVQIPTLSIDSLDDGNYFFRVYACNAAGCSSANGAKQLSVNVPLPAPAAPTFITGTFPERSDFGDFDFSWQSSGGSVSHYRLQQRRNTEAWPADNPANDINLNGLQTTLSPRGQLAGQYQFRLKACNEDACNSRWVVSPVIDVHNLDGIAPVVTTESSTVAGSMQYALSVSQQGDAQIVIPVQAAPGVNGLSPNITVAYSSGRHRVNKTSSLPEDILGYGWMLGGLSEIRRCVTGRPAVDRLQLTTADSLCLDGEPLVLTAGTHWQVGAQYRTLRDQLVRVELKGTAEQPWFEVLSPNGGVQQFGATSGSRVNVENAQGTSPFYAWSLNRVTDAFGNAITYTYHHDAVNGINYPIEIRYGNAGDAVLTFEYATRIDAAPMPLGASGFEQGQLVLLHHINVALDGVLQREYRLIPESAGEQKRLDKVQLCGFELNGYSSSCLPAVDFGWKISTSTNPNEFIAAVDSIDDGMKTASFDYTLMTVTNSSANMLEAPFGVGELPADTQFLAPVGGEYRYVVTAQHASNGINGVHTLTYGYQGQGVESTRNWGFLGYFAQRVQDVQSGIVTYRQFRLDFPYAGRVAQTLQSDAPFGEHTEILTQQQHRFGVKNLVTGAATTYFPYTVESLSYMYEGGVSLGVSQSSADYTVSGNTINAMESVERVAESATLSGGGAVWGDVPTASLTGIQRSQKASVTYTNRTDAGRWLLMFSQSTSQAHYAGDVTGAADRVVSETATPYGNTNRIDVLTRLPGDVKYELVSDFNYDAQGNLVEETVSGMDIATRTTSISDFSDQRYPGSVTNALQQSISMQYDPRFGAPVSVTDANFRTTSISHDPFGRERTRTNADNVTFSTEYTDCSYISCPLRGSQTVAYRVRSTSPISPTSDVYLDGLNRVVRTEVDAFDGSTRVAVDKFYDPLGRLQQQTTPYFTHESAGTGTIYSYDVRGRLDTVIKPDGSLVVHTVEPQPATREIKITVAEDIHSTLASVETQSKSSFYGIAGDLTQVIDDVAGAAVATAYTYDGAGQLKTVRVDGKAQATTTFNFDLAGFQSSIEDPNRGTLMPTYNALGQLVSQVDNKLQTVSFTYDVLGRVKTQTNSDGLAEWAYDPVNAIGALDYRRYTESGIESFFEQNQYRADGKLDTVTTQLAAGGLSRSYDHSYDYDGYGRIKSVTYPSQVAAHYAYTTGGYLEKITDGVNTLKTYNRFNAFGQVEEEVYGNGVITNRTYDPNTGSLVTLKTLGGLTALQDSEYKWRSNGTLESRLSRRDTLKEEHFSYDGLNRLRGAETQISGVTQRSLSTLYDQLGNIIQKSSSVASDVQVQFLNDSQDSAAPGASIDVTINGVLNTLNFDDNGAVVHYQAANGDDKWISWNSRRLPNQITRASTADSALPKARERFKYGPEGQRFYRESSWLDDSDQLQTERKFYLGQFEDVLPANDPDYARVQTARIDSNVVHLTRTTHLGGNSAAFEYQHRDHLGSVERVTDANGAPILDLAFDPFGGRKQVNWGGELSGAELKTLLEDLGASTRRGFTDHEHLDRTGLVHMNGRVYDPSLGRFVSPDPFVMAPTYSQGWNRYSYVYNNPLSLTDPSGFEAENNIEKPQQKDDGASSGSMEHMTVYGQKWSGSGRPDLNTSTSLQLSSSLSPATNSNTGGGGGGGGAYSFVCTTIPAYICVQPPQLTPPEVKANPFNVGLGVLKRDSRAQKGRAAQASGGIWYDLWNSALRTIGGASLTVDIPLSLLDKARSYIGLEPKRLPDVGFSVAAVIQPNLHPDGMDVGLIFSRRAGGTEGAMFKGALSLLMKSGSISSQAGSGYNGSIFVALAGATWSFNKNGMVTGSSYDFGLGMSMGVFAETSSTWSLNKGYTESGCDAFVC